MYFPKGFFSSGSLPWVFSEVATSQMCNFPRLHSPFCRGAESTLQPTAPQKAWEIAQLGSWQLGKCHLGSHP